MGGKSSGNRKASGQKGHKGGTGRPPKPPETRLTHKLNVGVNQALYDKIMIATMNDGLDNYQEFLRRHLEESL
jgi:hypothetical protein